MVLCKMVDVVKNDGGLKKSLISAMWKMKELMKMQDLEVQEHTSEIEQMLRERENKTAIMRATHLLRAKNKRGAYQYIMYYCRDLLTEIGIIDYEKRCPTHLGEAVSSILYAHSRCGGIEELRDLGNLLIKKYGKSFCSEAIHLHSRSLVNYWLIQKLATLISLEAKLEELKNVADLANITWDPSLTLPEHLGVGYSDTRRMTMVTNAGLSNAQVEHSNAYSDTGMRTNTGLSSAHDNAANRWKGFYSSYTQYFRDFLTKIDANPNLYGLVWIGTLMVFVIASLYVMQWRSDSYVSVAASIGYVLFVPLCFYFLLLYMGLHASRRLWGYSVLAFILCYFLLMITVGFIHWLVIFVSGGSFVALNFRSYARRVSSRRVSSID